MATYHFPPRRMLHQDLLNTLSGVMSLSKPDEFFLDELAYILGSQAYDEDDIYDAMHRARDAVRNTRGISGYRTNIALCYEFVTYLSITNFTVADTLSKTKLFVDF